MSRSKMTRNRTSKPPNPGNSKIIDSDQAVPRLLHSAPPKTESGIEWFSSFFMRRIKSILLVFLLFVFGTALYTFQAQPVYRSDATIEIPREGPDSTVSNKGPIALSAEDEHFETAFLMMTSKSLAELVVSRLHSGQVVKANSQDPVPQDHPASGLAHALVKEGSAPISGLSPAQSKELAKGLLRRLSVAKLPRTRLLTVAVEAPSPIEARNTLEAYLETYIRYYSFQMSKGSKERIAAIQEELSDAEARLSESKKALFQFARSNNFLTLDDQPMVSALKDRIVALQQEYAKKGGIYDAKSPRMVLLENEIKSLTSKVNEWEMGSSNVTILTGHEKLDEKIRSFSGEGLEVKNPVAPLILNHDLLKKEVDTNEQIYKNLLRKLRELNVDSKIGNKIAFIEAPTAHSDPVRPKPLRNMALGGLFGLVAGLLAAFVYETVDPRTSNSDDTERNLNLANLGDIPDLKKLPKRLNPTCQVPELIFHTYPKSLMSESIRNLKSALIKSSREIQVKSILVTSTIPAEGKTLISVLLASALATNDKRVLIVESDIRKPRMGKIFGIEQSASGLSTLLKRNNAKISDALVYTAISGVYFLPCGPVPHDPAGLLESDVMKKLLRQCRDSFDYCVFDSAPIMSCSDSTILASQVDGVLLIIRESYLSMGMIRSAIRKLRSVDANLMGFAFNASSRFAGYMHSNYYGYYGVELKRKPN